MQFKLKFVSIGLLVAVVAASSVAVIVRANDEDAEGKETKLAQKDLPANVLTAFQKAYPKAEIKGVDKEVDSSGIVYEIESVEGTAKRTTVFTSAGILSEVEEVITMKDLPQTAQQSLKANYPEGEAVAIERVTRGDTVTFEVLMESDEAQTELVFDQDGKTIKTEMKAEDEDDEGD